MKQTLWIDLTDFTIWRGTHTGTQRVVYQIVKNAPKTENVKYCWYDYRTKTYSQVDPSFAFHEDDSEQLNRGTKKETIKKIKNLSDKVSRNVLPPIAERAYSRVVSKLERSQNQTEISITASIEAGDKLLILGGNWDKPNFIDVIERLNDIGVKVIHNINDLIPIFDKGHVSSDEHVRYEDFMRRVIKLASRLTAISEYTKSDIKKYCESQGIDCPKIDVIRLGDDSVKKESKKVKGINGDYILSVSTIEVRKNHLLLYYVYKEAIKKGIKLPRLVLAGRRGWLTGDLQFMLTHDPQIKDMITIVEGPSDEELSWLYQNCMFTVYPSFYEGWGLPVAESILHGKYCLATNATSVPEIAGDLLDYFSPFNTAECLEGILKATNKSYLSEKEKQLKLNYKPTSWEDTANKLFKSIL